MKIYNVSRWIIVFVILFFVGGLVFQYQNNKIKNIKEQYNSEIKLRNALQDNIDEYVNKNGVLVQEKLTIQSDLDRVKELNNYLTENQKLLFKKIGEANKNIEILAAAHLRYLFVIDSLEKIIAKGKYDDSTKTILYTFENKDIKFNFLAKNVMPFDITKDNEGELKSLVIPNEQYIQFFYDKKDKRNKYPISFSVSNSNNYLKAYDIDSYIIPEINKEAVNKNFFQRTKDWFNRKSTLLKFGVGVGAGIIIGNSF